MQKFKPTTTLRPANFKIFSIRSKNVVPTVKQSSIVRRKAPVTTTATAEEEGEVTDSTTTPSTTVRRNAIKRIPTSRPAAMASGTTTAKTVAGGTTKNEVEQEFTKFLEAVDTTTLAPPRTTTATPAREKVPSLFRTKKPLFSQTTPRMEFSEREVHGVRFRDLIKDYDDEGDVPYRQVRG